MKEVTESVGLKTEVVNGSVGVGVAADQPVVIIEVVAHGLTIVTVQVAVALKEGGPFKVLVYVITFAPASPVFSDLM